MRLQIKKTYLLAASALFLWGWNLLLPAMLFIDMFLLALVSALADLLLKQREETWIPLLAYPLSPRPLILRTCLRHCGWWLLFSLPFCLFRSVDAIILLLCVSLAGCSGSLLHTFLVPDGYLSVGMRRVNVGQAATLLLLYQLPCQLNEWEPLGTSAFLLFLIIWLISLIAVLAWGPRRMRKKVSNALALPVFLKQQRLLTELSLVRPAGSRDLYARLLQRLLPSRSPQAWKIAAMLPILVRRLYLYLLLFSFSLLLPYATGLLILLFLGHLVQSWRELRQLPKRLQPVQRY